MSKKRERGKGNTRRGEEMMGEQVEERGEEGNKGDERGGEEGIGRWQEETA